MDTPQSPSTKQECCSNGMCGKCLHGGLPMRKDFLSFLVLGCIGMVTVLGVLLVGAKRELYEMRSTPQVDDDKKVAAALPSPVVYPTKAPHEFKSEVTLPKPTLTSTTSIEKALQTRRSARAYTKEKVKLGDLSQMLWAGQGITVPGTEKRTAPSARESYPMTLYVVAKRVDGLEPGLYEYLPKTHTLGLLSAGDMDPKLKESGVQAGAQEAPVVVLVSAAIGNYQAKTKSTTTTATYLEAGHIGQNMYLQAVSLKMGMVVMAGFDSKKVVTALGMDPGETVEYVAPMGYPAPEPSASPKAE